MKIGIKNYTKAPSQIVKKYHKKNKITATVYIFTLTKPNKK